MPQACGSSASSSHSSSIGALGVVLQLVVFRRMEGEDLRQTLVTIGISIVIADLMLWIWGGDFYQILPPDWLNGPMTLPFVTAVKSSGEAVFLKYPIVRLVILFAAIVIGVGMWLIAEPHPHRHADPRRRRRP